MTITWQSIKSVTLPKMVGDWLADSSSMTKRLRAQCQNTLKIEVIEHRWAQATDQDSTYLSLSPNTKIINREVILYCYDQPWMYARTVLPYQLVEAVGTELIELGERPIGELLFADPDMTRSEFEVAELTNGNTEYNRATRFAKVNDVSLWARRSIFDLPHQGQLAITEVFFPICWTH